MHKKQDVSKSFRKLRYLSSSGHEMKVVLYNFFSVFHCRQKWEYTFSLSIILDSRLKYKENTVFDLISQQCMSYTFCFLGNIFHAFCRLQIFFKIIYFEKFFQEYHHSQTVWIQIRPNILSGLMWVQTVCKGYQQTTLGGKELTL